MSVSINHIIVSISGLTLLLLVGSGIKNPQLFENQGYSTLTSLLVGGMLGVVTTSSSTNRPNNEKDEDDYSIR